MKCCDLSINVFLKIRARKSGIKVLVANDIENLYIFFVMRSRHVVGRMKDIEN